MKLRSKVILGAIVIGIVVAVLLVASMLRRGFSTHDQPSRIEAVLARSMRHWAVPSDLRDVKNPVPLTPQVLADGRAHFADHCAGCHRNDGRGGGMGKQMYPEAPDMTLAATQSLSDGELFSIIENGVRLTGMPGFGSGTAESAYGSWGSRSFHPPPPEADAGGAGGDAEAQSEIARGVAATAGRGSVPRRRRRRPAGRSCGRSLRTPALKGPFPCARSSSTRSSSSSPP